MIIHTVQPGDTINSIAELYNIPEIRLQQDNDLPPGAILNVGRALMIINPEQTYVVQSGDTLASIANSFGVTILQLIRNNPQLSVRESFTLILGEELIISYNNKEKKIKVNGFANSFINSQVLKRTLPYLTYITILEYRINPDGSLINVTDTEAVQMAKEYGVAPLMFISSIDERGVGSYGITHNLLNNQVMQNYLIENILIMLKVKGYYGLHLGFQNILPQDLSLYVDFVALVTKRMNQEGYEVFVSLIPSTFGFKPGEENENPYFAEIGQVTNYVTLITYQWSTALMSKVAETTYSFLKEYLDFVVTQIPPEKIFITLTRIAYDWELPYVEGETMGKFLTNSGAIDLAIQVNETIEFDETTETPYFFYYTLDGVAHYVWFKDARSFIAILNLVFDYNLYGIAIWNIMYYYAPTWLVLNTQYDIETILDNTLAESI